MLIVSRTEVGSFMAKVSEFQKGYYAVVTDLSDEVLWTQEVSSIEMGKQMAVQMAKNFEITRKYLLLSEAYKDKSTDCSCNNYSKKASFCRERAILRGYFGFWFEYISKF